MSHAPRQVFLKKTVEVPETKVDELEQLIRQKFALKTGFAEPHQLSRVMQQTLQNFDLSETSELTPQQFKTALNKLNCGENADHVAALFRRYDRDGSERLNMKEFCNGLFGLATVPLSNPQCRNIISIVRDRILQRGGQNGYRSLVKTLRVMDDNGNRQLDKEELRTGLLNYGIDMTNEELSTLFYYFDRDKSGQISVTEFIVGIRGKMSKPREELVKQAYLRLDKNSDGRCTFDDIKQAYKADKHPEVVAGKKSPVQVLKEFCAMWDKNGDDEITEEEFVQYYNDISASIDNDEYFELMIRNAWHIHGGEGAARNTANLRVLVTHMDGSQDIEVILDDLGLNKKDEKAITQALIKQGVTDILRVELR